MNNPTNKPNILVIMSDEHDAGVLGCYGDKLVNTPHLDGLAANGITFDNHYCNSPLCVPSRLSFTAGKYIHRVGAWGNSCRLPSDDMPSLPRVLRSAGYTPYLCGKQHYDKSRRYGFEDLAPEFNQASKNGRHGRRAVDDHGENVKNWQERSAEFYPSSEGWLLDHDRKVTSIASDFLRKRGVDEEPFMLFAGYLAPHFPLVAPDELYQKYKNKVPMPTIPEGLIENLPKNYRHLRQGFGVTNAETELVQKGRDLYWALTEWFDGQVGELLGALGDSDVADNTVVIYTSDHGENKGDHGLWWKNNHYDHGSRVPLIVSWSKRWGGGVRRSQVCSLVDVVQTIIDLAGGEAPDDFDGDSLLPVMENDKAAWKDFAVSMYYGHNIASGMNMYREGRYKYIFHNRYDEANGPERELFDMLNDPQEFVNLANRPEHQALVERLHQALVEELGEDPNVIESRCRAEGLAGYDQETVSEGGANAKRVFAGAN